MKSAREIWETALGELQVQITKPNFDTWLKDTIGLSYDNNCFTIGVPNAFVGEWLNNRLRSLIIKTLVSIIGEDTDIQFSVHTGDHSITSPIPVSQTDGGLSSRVRAEVFSSPRLNPKYTFNTFIVGNCNRFAYSAALEVAERRAEHYNPLFICSSTGLGKTHLLQAIGHITMNKRLGTLYLTAEQFTNEFIRFLKEDKNEGFRNRFRSVQVLLMDDIHFLSGKGQIQECFLHLFNELYQTNAQIVITSDRPPKLIPLLNNKLRSRFEWGLIAHILPPEINTRLAILKTKAEERGLKIQPEVLQFLAEKVQGSVRELVGALNCVIAYAQTNKTNLSLCLATEALADMTTQTRNATAPNLIIELVAGYFGLTPEVLMGRERDSKTSLARQIAIYLMREESHCTLAQISQELGNRDHSTILYNYHKIKEQLKTEPEVRSQVAEILQALKFTTKGKSLWRIFGK